MFAQDLANKFEDHFNSMMQDIITQIIANPDILWQRRFLQQMGTLPFKQKNLIIDWFTQLNLVNCNFIKHNHGV